MLRATRPNVNLAKTIVDLITIRVVSKESIYVRTLLSCETARAHPLRSPFFPFRSCCISQLIDAADHPLLLQRRLRYG